MSYDNKKKKNWWDNSTERKSTAEVLYPNQFNNAPGKLNPVLQQEEDEHKKKVAYYQQQLGRQLTGSEVLYPDNIQKNSRGESIPSYKDWAAKQTQQASFANPGQSHPGFQSDQQGQRESSLCGAAQQPTRQQRLYAQATGNATDVAPRAQPQLNEWGYYHPGPSEFAHIDHGPNAPLGLRNHNPANLVDTNDAWNGMTGVDRNGFVQFESDHDGIRAAARSMNNQSRRGLNTVRQLIGRNSNAEVGNPEAIYREEVARRMGVGVDDVLDLDDPEVLATVTQAVIEFELGQSPFTREQYMNATRDALHRR